jgi:hypothetical protein
MVLAEDVLAASPAELQREATRLRKRFQLTKERLRSMARDLAGLAQPGRPERERDVRRLASNPEALETSAPKKVRPKLLEASPPVSEVELPVLNSVAMHEVLAPSSIPPSGT